MKTIIIFSILLLPSILWGQVINHFGNLDSKWNVAKSYPAANQQNPSFVATTTKVFGFQGDSIINSEQWFKIYSTNDSLFQNDLVYRGLLRAENSKVFYIDTLNQLDTLYDFSLNVGDSVLFELYGIYPEWLQVINVDSIQIDGDYYRRLKFDEPSITAFDWLDEEWIEGIGSKHGPLFPAFPVKFSEEIPDSMLLTCSFSDNQQIWQHPSYASCYVNIVLSVENVEYSDFEIYPNPFSSHIIIENNKNKEYKLTIINSSGQVIRKEQTEANTQTIDLAELKAGIYLLKINDQELIKTMKIIKH
jgi:hypothetical protein